MKSNFRKTSNNYQDTVCNIYITCSGPCEDGGMEVELNYEGDTALAAKMINGAQNYMTKHQEYESQNRKTTFRLIK